MRLRRALPPSLAALFLGTALLALLPGAAAAARPACGDGTCNGSEVCDGTDFCSPPSCPLGQVATCDPLCGGFTCAAPGGGAGTVELLFTDRSDDVSESHISAAEQRLLDLIDGETVSIRAAIDDLSRDNVVDRLLAAEGRGVTVEVVADCEIVVVGANAEYQRLEAAGIPVVDDDDSFDGPSVNPGCTSRLTSGFVHDKFLVFGGQQTVWTGSTNLTDFGFNASQNAIVILAGNPGIVDFYTAEFDEMFGNGLSLRAGGTGRFGRQKTLDPGIGRFTLADGTGVEIAFSPYDYSSTSDTEQLIDATIDSAADELLWGTYFLTYDPIRTRIDANPAPSKRGSVDPRTTDDFPLAAEMIAAGEEVLVTNFLGSHHWKLVIADADDADGQVLVASHNFSNSSFNFNNENSVRLLSPSAAQVARSAFDAVWTDPQNAGLVGCIHSGESFNQNSRPLHRCNDGFDNDFDGFVDGADSDCSSFFTCGGGTSCQAPGLACSSDADCCSGTCLHGKTRTCE